MTIGMFGASSEPRVCGTTPPRQTFTTETTMVESYDSLSGPARPPIASKGESSYPTERMSEWYTAVETE